MILTILSVIIGLLIYDLFKKLIKILFIKKQNDNLKSIIEGATKIFPYDKDFWEDK